MPSFRSSGQAAAKQAQRITMLETARELLRDRPWNGITMAHLASAVGVSRQTLYNEFGSRSGFVEAYLLYDADRILGAVERAIETAGGVPAVALERAFGVFLEAIGEDPLALAVLSGEDDDGLLSLVTTRGRPVLQIAAHRIGEAIAESWPQARPDDIALLAEQLVRLAISHTALPDEVPTETARAISQLLTPFAEVALLRAAIDGDDG